MHNRLRASHSRATVGQNAEVQESLVAALLALTCSVVWAWESPPCFLNWKWGKLHLPHEDIVRSETTRVARLACFLCTMGFKKLEKLHF